MSEPGPALTRLVKELLADYAEIAEECRKIGQPKQAQIVESQGQQLAADFGLDVAAADQSQTGANAMSNPYTDLMLDIIIGIVISTALGWLVGAAFALWRHKRNGRP